MTSREADLAILMRRDTELRPVPRNENCLRPFDPREAISVREAMALAGVASERTMAGWCADFGIGRKRGGQWQVSRVALRMYLNGDEDGLEAYLTGERSGGKVAKYYRALGLQCVLDDPEFQSLLLIR